jgi:hypothetical protein
VSARRQLAIAAILVAIVSARLAAQDTGAIAGRVVLRADTAAPARGAVVSIAGTALADTTNADGRFLLAPLGSGQRTLRVRLPGWRTAERIVLVRAGDTARVDVVLRPDVQLLETVRTNARFFADSVTDAPALSTLSLDAAAIAGVPAVGEPDVVRLVQLLPGVVSRNDFNTGLIVRGGEADQNLVLLDGFPLYNPFHLGGLFSTFMDATVGGLELLTGAFPARYGDRLSSVLAVRSAEEHRPGLHTTADLSALGATARFAGAFDDGAGTWSVAGRRTYADAAQRIFTNDVFPYHFHDLQAHATYALRGGVRLALTAYEGRDVLDADLAAFQSDSVFSKSSRGRWKFDWGNQLLGVAATKDFGDRVTLEQRLSTTAFSTNLNLGDGAFAQRSEVRELRASGSLRLRGDVHEPSLGYELAAQRLRYASGSSATQTTDVDLVQRPVSAALWLDDVWHLTPRLTVEGGLRGETQSARHWAALSPRASLRVEATPLLALTAGVGRITQTMHSLAGDGALRYFDIWLASDSFVPVATAWHYVAGAERRVRNAGLVRVEGYVKHYDRVLEANLSDDPQRRGDEFLPASGLSYGADLLARWQPDSGVSGWVAYSYGVSERTRDGTTWSPGSDRRHDLEVVARWQLAKYRVGARFGFATGTPYTPIVGGVTRRAYDPSTDRWGTGDPEIVIESLGASYNSARFPPNHRLDLDVSRDFLVRGATVTPYLGLANAYNAHNVFVYLYSYSTDLPTRRAISQFPILPSAGVRVAF